MQKKAS